MDLRFIAATNRDVNQAVKQGILREDLFYRLNVVTLHLPPLRERKEDIPVLSERFLNSYAHELGKGTLELDASALNVLMEYPWPGNVRELKNIMERAVLIATGKVIRHEHIPDELKKSDSFLGESLNETLSIEGTQRNSSGGIKAP